jgi:integrase
VVRLFYDYLQEIGLRADVPLSRRSFTPGNGFYGTRDRALVPYFERFPWIPGDDEWEAILSALAAEPVRNRLMLLLSYDGALRRGELLALSTSDIRAPLRQIVIRPEIAKNRSGRIVLYGAVTAELLRRYLDHRHALGVRGGALFRSESPRNYSQPLSIHAWTKIVAGIAERAGTPRFTPHTLRHLRLTDLARCGTDLHAISLYAGHRSLDTTRLYLARPPAVPYPGTVADRLDQTPRCVEATILSPSDDASSLVRCRICMRGGDISANLHAQRC